MPTPLAVCDTSKIHLYSQIDSTWYEAEFKFRPVESNIRTYELLADWRPGVEYSFETDSAAFIDIYGLVSNANKIGIKAKDPKDFGTLQVNVSGIEAVDTTIIVQLLNNSGSVEREKRVNKGMVKFDYMREGKYYMSALIDANGNGVWDTGDYDKDLQPEAVYFYPKEIECKEKWDNTLSWNLTSTPDSNKSPTTSSSRKLIRRSSLETAMQNEQSSWASSISRQKA